jgi:hypothetical protein
MRVKDMVLDGPFILPERTGLDKYVVQRTSRRTENRRPQRQQQSPRVTQIPAVRR